MSLLKLSHALIKHKNFINYILPSTSHLPQSYWSLPTKLFDSYLTNHEPIPHPSYHNISLQTKSLNQPLLIVWFVWLSLYGVFMLCYFLCYSCAKSYVPSWEKGSILFFRKASDTHIPYPFYLCISIFTSCSMHDRCFTQLFYQLLRS
jgi:hypothetical protein